MTSPDGIHSAVLVSYTKATYTVKPGTHELRVPAHSKAFVGDTSLPVRKVGEHHVVYVPVTKTTRVDVVSAGYGRLGTFLLRKAGPKAAVTFRVAKE